MTSRGQGFPFLAVSGPEKLGAAQEKQCTDDEDRKGYVTFLEEPGIFSQPGKVQDSECDRVVHRVGENARRKRGAREDHESNDGPDDGGRNYAVEVQVKEAEQYPRHDRRSSLSEHGREPREQESPEQNFFAHCGRDAEGDEGQQNALPCTDSEGVLHGSDQILRHRGDEILKHRDLGDQRHQARGEDEGADEMPGRREGEAQDLSCVHSPRMQVEKSWEKDEAPFHEQCAACEAPLLEERASEEHDRDKQEEKEERLTCLELSPPGGVT